MDMLIGTILLRIYQPRCKARGLVQRSKRPPTLQRVGEHLTIRKLQS